MKPTLLEKLSKRFGEKQAKIAYIDILNEYSRLNELGKRNEAHAADQLVEKPIAETRIPSDPSQSPLRT